MASVFLFSPDTNNTVGKLIIVQIKSNFLNLTRDKQHAIIDNKSETLEPKVEASGPNLACQSFFFFSSPIDFNEIAALPDKSFPKINQHSKREIDDENITFIEKWTMLLISLLN